MARRPQDNMSTRPRDRDALVVNLVHALAEQPGATMTEIASLAGVSRATLFRYYPCRQNMVDAVMQACVDQTEAALRRARPREGHFEAALLRTIEEMLPVAEMCAHITPHTPGEKAAPANSSALRTSLIALFRQWQNEGSLRADLPAAWMVESLVLLLRGSATLIRSGHVARNEAARNIFELLCRGITK